MRQAELKRDIFEIKKLLEKQEIVKKYLAFQSLTKEQRQKTWNDWEQYYKDVRETPSYLMWIEQKKALKDRNMAMAKDLGKQASEMLRDPSYHWQQKPHEYEPLSLFHDQLVIKYRGICEEIRLVGERHNSLAF